MLKWYKLGSRQVHIPSACDVFIVDGIRYVRRERGRSSYWVDSRGVEWRSAKQRQRLEQKRRRLASWRKASAKRRAVRNT